MAQSRVPTWVRPVPAAYANSQTSQAAKNAYINGIVQRSNDDNCQWSSLGWRMRWAQNQVEHHAHKPCATCGHEILIKYDGPGQSEPLYRDSKYWHFCCWDQQQVIRNSATLPDINKKRRAQYAKRKRDAMEAPPVQALALPPQPQAEAVALPPVGSPSETGPAYILSQLG